MSVHLGRLEERPAESEAAHELLQYLSNLRVRVDPTVYRDLVAIGSKHKRTRIVVEKAVDVMLAVDLVVMAERNEYDAAYVLSADGDYTHAVRFVRSKGKKVFAVSASRGAQLASVVNAFIRIDAGWLTGCFTAV